MEHVVMDLGLELHRHGTTEADRNAKSICVLKSYEILFFAFWQQIVY